MLDIANNFAGTLMGVINALGSEMVPLCLVQCLYYQATPWDLWLR